VFHGEPDGQFQAYDARTANCCGSGRPAPGADAPAITYEIDARNYVAIAVGGVSIQTTSANAT